MQQRAVKFHDVDAAGIVFYPRLFEWFHDAYVAFLADAGAPLPEVLEQALWAAPIRHAEAEFLRPLRFGESVGVALLTAHVEGSTATLGYRIRTEAGEVAAVGQSAHVFVAPDTFAKVPIPDHLARRLRELGTL